MMKTLIFAVAFLLAACTQPDTARRVLEDAGYKNVRMEGYEWNNCSADDFYHDRFSATGPTGRSVSGVVCTGLLNKGSTIRFD